MENQFASKWNEVSVTVLRPLCFLFQWSAFTCHETHWGIESSAVQGRRAQVRVRVRILRHQGFVVFRIIVIWKSRDFIFGYYALEQNAVFEMVWDASGEHAQGDSCTHQVRTPQMEVHTIHSGLFWHTDCQGGVKSANCPNVLFTRSMLLCTNFVANKVIIRRIDLLMTKTII